MDYRIVVPVLDPTLGRQCLTALDAVDHSRVIVVDNAPDAWPLPWRPGWVHRPIRNAGVAWSWNVGARNVVRMGADILAIVSQAVVMRDGGRSLLNALAQADEWGVDIVSHGWHLIGFTRHALATIGPFDEGFYPGYMEDTDWLYRMGLAGAPSPRENGRSMPFAHVDHDDAGPALMVTGGQVTPNWRRLEARYAAKWGGPQGAETYRSPWDSGQPGWWWPDTPYPLHDPWGGLV